MFALQEKEKKRLFFGMMLDQPRKRLKKIEKSKKKNHSPSVEYRHQLSPSGGLWCGVWVWDWTHRLETEEEEEEKNEQKKKKRGLTDTSC